MTSKEKFQQITKAARLIEKISTDQTFPAALRKRALGILLTLDVNKAGVTQVVDIINNTNASIENRLEALDVLGQLVQRGFGT